MLEFLWEMHQERQIGDATIQAGRAVRDAAESYNRSSEQEARADTMALTLMAMWSIMQERFGVTEAELVRRMQEIDMRDGKLDGKVTPGMWTCDACHRQVSARRKRCLYCGAEGAGIRPFAGM